MITPTVRWAGPHSVFERWNFFRTWRGWATPALFMTIAAFHVWALLRFPAPFVDEAWNVSRGWALIQTGEVFGPLDRGVVDRFDGYRIVPPWVPTLILSLSIRSADAPSLPAARLVSLAFEMLLLMAVYAIATRIGGSGLGRLSAVLTSLSWPFLYSAHLARFDVYSAAFGLSAVALYLSPRPLRIRRSALSGLSLGVGFVMHPNALVYAPAIAALFFLENRWSMVRRPDFWAFAAGASFGPVFHAVRHILPRPEIYAALGELGLGAGYLPPIATFDPRELVRSFSETGGRLMLFYQALLPLVPLGLGLLLARRAKADKVLLILAVVPVLSFALLIQSKATYYGIYYTPTIDVAVAAFLTFFFRRPWRGRLQDYISRVFVWSACLGWAALNLLPLQYDAWQVYRTTQDRLCAVVRPDETVLGVQTYWFGLYDQAYYSWEQLVYYQHYAPGSTLEDAFGAFRPNVFIADRFLDYFIFDPRNGIYDPRDGSSLPYLWLPKSELDEFLDKRAVLVVEFGEDTYGPIRVYRLDWK